MTTSRLLDLTAEDVMKHDLVTVPRRESLADAARLFRRHQISGAPVVDERGRCVGVLTAADFLRWAEEGCPAATTGPARSCAFQTEGQLLTGEAAMICTLAPGNCPLQSLQPTTGGRHTAICRQPRGVLCDWQQSPEAAPEGGVAERYMTADVVSVEPALGLTEVARQMIDAHIHHVFVLDADRRPVGVVTSTDILAALAWEWHPFAGPHDLACAKETCHELP